VVAFPFFLWLRSGFLSVLSVLCVCFVSSFCSLRFLASVLSVLSGWLCGCVPGFCLAFPFFAFFWVGGLAFSSVLCYTGGVFGALPSLPSLLSLPLVWGVGPSPGRFPGSLLWGVCCGFFFWLLLLLSVRFRGLFLGRGLLALWRVGCVPFVGGALRFLRPALRPVWWAGGLFLLLPAPFRGFSVRGPWCLWGPFPFFPLSAFFSRFPALSGLLRFPLRLAAPLPLSLLFPVAVWLRGGGRVCVRLCCWSLCRALGGAAWGFGCCASVAGLGVGAVGAGLVLGFCALLGASPCAVVVWAVRLGFRGRGVASVPALSWGPLCFFACFLVGVLSWLGAGVLCRVARGRGVAALLCPFPLGPVVCVGRAVAPLAPASLRAVALLLVVGGGCRGGFGGGGLGLVALGLAALPFPLLSLPALLLLALPLAPRAPACRRLRRVGARLASCRSFPVGPLLLALSRPLLLSVVGAVAVALRVAAALARRGFRAGRFADKWPKGSGHTMRGFERPGGGERGR